MALLSAIAGPSSYFAAYKAGAIAIDWQRTEFLVCYILFWAGVLPLVKYLRSKS